MPVRRSSTAIPTAGAARSPSSSVPLPSGSAPWSPSRTMPSPPARTCAGFPPGARTVCGPWSWSAPTGASAASAAGACPSRCSTARTAASPSAPTRPSTPSPISLKRRAPTPGSRWRRRICCRRASPAPTAARTPASRRRPTPWTAGSTPAPPTTPPWSGTRASGLPPCISRVWTSIAAGSRAPCWWPWALWAGARPSRSA